MTRNTRPKFLIFPTASNDVTDGQLKITVYVPLSKALITNLQRTFKLCTLQILIIITTIGKTALS
jgi:hypothetical protein